MRILSLRGDNGVKGFVRISKYAGMREDIVQAGGGNAAFKATKDKMFIKASGFQLADVTETEGFAIVNPSVIREAFLTDKNVEGMNENEGKKILNAAFIEGSRPSIETFLHSISGRYSLHTHPIVVNAITCRKNGRDILNRLFPDALFVPYATPGIELAKAYFTAYRGRADKPDQIFDTVFLQNHGLLVSADTAEAVIRKTEDILQKIEKYLDVDMSACHAMTKIWEAFADKILWKVTDENILSTYRKNGMWNHAFCPDCVVFLGKKALVLHDHFTQEKQAFEESHGAPVMVVYRDNLYILADSVRKAMEIQSVMSFSAQVMRLNDGLACNFLDEREQNFLLDWDAENYRKNINICL